MTVAPARVVTATDAVDQQVNLGLGDPVEIADAVLRLYGEAEAFSWFDARALLADVARHRLGLRRRGMEAAALRSPAASVEAFRDGRRYVWIPDVGSVRSDLLTAEHCLARAAILRELERQNGAKAVLYEAVAAAIRFGGVETLGELPEQERIISRLVELGEAA